MKLYATSKRMILVICLSAFIFILAGAVVYRSAAALPFALGVILTSALNCAKAVMIEHAVIRSADMGENAKRFVGLQYGLRLLLTLAVLAVCVLSPLINVWGAAVGLFTLQISAISMRFFSPQDQTGDNGAEPLDG